MNGHDKWLPGILCDQQIAHLARDHEMISPFVGQPVRTVTKTIGSNDEHPTTMGRKVVSYGLGHYGYDMRVGSVFRIFTPTSCHPVDPKHMPDDVFDEVASQDSILIPPNSFALACSVERFHIPDNVIALVIGKSTYARCGITINCTPMEPGWQGYLTIEISNTTPLPARIYANEGIAQALFFQGSAKCAMTYADKGGKYMHQDEEIVLPKM